MSAPMAVRRWRLVLGRFADPALDRPLDEIEAQMDRALDRLYGVAYGARGLRLDEGRGSLETSRLVALPHWLGEIGRLFPAGVCETIRGHAIERLGLGEMLADPDVLGSLTPNLDLLRALIAFRGHASPAMAATIRAVARDVVEELMKRSRTSLARALSGARRRAPTSRRAGAALDWRRSVRLNLKNWDADRRAIVAQRLRFSRRSRRRLPWSIILCVDQSGSMLTSVIHSAVMAAALAALPGVSLRFVLFDSAVVDLSASVGDPVETLLAVQLGGGTDIGRALTYCETLVRQPSRTILALVSDFGEGGPPARLIAAVRRLAEARVTLLGVAALDDHGDPAFDRGMAQRLASAGMSVAALTPDRFAEWIAGIIA